MNSIGKDREAYIPVITRKESVRVNLREILYIETQRRLVYIHTSTRVYRFYGKMNDVVKYINDNFYRCHKSCIINFDKITQMEDGLFFFKGGMTLRVGQNNYQHARSFFRKFLIQNEKENSDIV